MIDTVTTALGERALEGYTAHLRALGRSEGTVEQRLTYVRRMMRDLNMAPDAITWAEVETWLAAHTWARNTRRVAVASLRDFFSCSSSLSDGQANPGAWRSQYRSETPHGRFVFGQSRSLVVPALVALLLLPSLPVAAHASRKAPMSSDLPFSP